MKLARDTPMVIAIVALSAAARAQGNAANVARAEKLFNEAKTLLEGGRAADACARFDESEKLDPQLGTLLNLALCNEQIGKSASAWAEFNEVVGLATRAGQAKRADLAKKHVLSLEPSLARAKIDVSRAPADATLQLDGAPLSITPDLRLPLDPGEHVLVASAPNHVSTTVRFDVARAGSETTVIVPALATAQAATPLAGPPLQPGPGPASSGGEEKPARATAPWKTVGWITSGVGLGGLAFGFVAGGIALGRANDARSACPHIACDTSAGYDANQSAHSWATVSTVSIIGGAALVALGAALIFLVPDHDAARAASKGASAFDLRF